MAARKKNTTTASRSASPARAFAVVLEDVRSQFKVFGEALRGVTEKLDHVHHEMASGFARVEPAFRAGQPRARPRQSGRDRSRSRELREIRSALEKKIDRDDVEAIVERAAARSGAR